MASIKPIVGSSVHQIQSGQVIVDLCSVVKELVENSLDAGATSVDVRFKNQGLESIEVQDNGSGISKDDYESIALKHYTSKLSTYDDLTSLKTFGFRGEALSSLCAVSDLHINTAREDEAPKGTRLDFEVSGRLKGTQVVASQKGTTVVVETVFKNLPVRRQELSRNIKREYSKVLGLLQAYACISINVKFSVSNVTGKGKKVVAFATKPNKTTRENIANVFGAKTLVALVALDLEFEMHRSSSLLRTQNADRETQVRVVGHVSKPIFGEGRQTPDRQMFFVNSRPCSLPQVAKVMNEVYKSFNVSQSPYIFANVLLDTNAYDVNVSPDKRTILLHDQGDLLEALRTSLTELFDNQQQTVPQSLTQLKSTFLPKSSTPKGVVLPSAVNTINSGNVVPAGPREKFHGEDEEDSGIENETTTRATDLESRASNRIGQFDKTKLRGRDSESGFQEEEEADGPKFARERRRLSSTNVAEEDDDSPVENKQSMTSAAPPRKIVVGADQPVLDFNKRLAEFQPAVSSGAPSPPSSRASSEADIPSISQSPGKATPGVVPNAFDRMRPLRTPLQEATITIDDKVFTSVIVSQPAQQQNRYTLAPTRSKATPKRVPPANLGFSQTLSSFRAVNSSECTQSEVVGGNSDEVEGTVEDGEGVVELEGEKGDDRDEVSQSQVSDQDLGVSETIQDTTQETQNLRPTVVQGRPRKVELCDASTPDDVHTTGSSEAPLDPLDILEDDDDGDAEYLDEATKKAREDDKVARIIQEAEERAARSTEDDSKRAQSILKGINRKYATFNLSQTLDVSIEDIDQQIRRLEQSLETPQLPQISNEDSLTQIEPNTSAEDRLSLTVTKADFEHMRVIGQFNLGFIIAFRSFASSPTSTLSTPNSRPTCPDIFIIDQHASDEKSNFENLQQTTTVQAQPLVNAFPLGLTAIEEEIIIENQESFTKNGFIISIDESGDSQVGQRCKLLALPMSKELTFDLRDLEELVALLAESSDSSARQPLDLPSGDDSCQASSLKEKAKRSTIIRPTKVRKMFAMRACRSSIMVGKSLTHNDMRKVVRRMGEMDKPWNCPHGRPTMRHLVGLKNWEGWLEGDGLAAGGNEMEEAEEADDRDVDEEIDWANWMKGKGVRDE